MELFIAEKPSVAKAIAAELKVTSRGDGYYECGDKTITWCFGHLLELATPEAYLPDDIPLTKKGTPVWRFEDLPIFPTEWKIIPKKDAKKQLGIIKELLKKADSVVNAGDPDREGCLLVDEVLEYFKNTKPVKRFWVSAQDSTSIRRGLENLKENKDFEGWTNAARARSHGDWLIGMNLTRAYTNYKHELMTIGRVQTPTLHIVVQRDENIKNFKPVPYFNIFGTIQHANGNFRAKWKAQENQDGLDEEGRLVSKEIASQIVETIKQQSGSIEEFKQEKKEKKQPLVFSLSDITAKANAKYGYGAEATLKICQNLYEKHKLTSYPRTDSSYLPESQFADAGQVFDALKDVLPKIYADDTQLLDLLDKCDLSIKSKTWDDSKVTAHHGIIPTMQDYVENELSDEEKAIYKLIVKQYLAQFFPVCEYLQTNVKVNVNGETLTAQGKIITKQGWQEVFGKEAADEEKSDAEADDEQNLPQMQNGDAVNCIAAELKDEKTKPPKPFTEGTLIKAMENIHKYLDVDDSNIKNLLKDGDGIGTSATRAGIIGELKRRGFIETKGKTLVATQKGNELINTLREKESFAKDIALTAVFERYLKQIENKEIFPDKFVTAQKNAILDELKKLAKDIKERAQKPKPTPSTIHTCQKCGSGLIRRENKKTGKFWWGCSGFPKCKQTYFDKDGKPNYDYEKRSKPNQ